MEVIQFLNRFQYMSPFHLLRGGIPRIIPSFHRVQIIKGGERGDRIVQLYLSLFSVSRLIALAPKVTQKTFSSITTPHPNPTGSVKIKDAFLLIQRYVPRISSIPCLSLNLKLK